MDIARENEWWPGMRREPFNGQRVRLGTVRRLIEQFEPDGFIETGTLIGTTTRFFCGNGLPVYTAEIEPAHWLLARLRLGWDSDAKAVLGDSRTMLRELAAGLPFSRPLAYLDAHWGTNLPLAEEISLLCEAWPEVIVVIDDFRVDGDDGYLYDVYDSMELSLRHIALPAGLATAFPAIPSNLETGAKRGTLYGASGPDATRAIWQLVEEGLLRKT